MHDAPPPMPMDLPVSNPGPVKEEHCSFHCHYCDPEVVHKIAQVLLPGLATACVDSTSGDFFRSPSVVAVELRKELIDYITERSETYVSEILLRVQESAGGPDPAPELPTDDPSEIAADLVEEFTATKRNLLSLVSGWILSDGREDKIDDLVQEMEKNRFWEIDRREAVAEALLRNLDYKNEFHCSMRFEEEQEFAEHNVKCSFRPVICSNKGCRVKFCFSHEEQHELICLYKVLPCEQKCAEMILRREMDRHCVTACPMKLVNCPFYQIGCQSAFPHCRLREHCRQNLRTHLICLLPVLHRNEDSSEDEWNELAEALDKAQTEDQLAKALDVRALTAAIKSLEAKNEEITGISN
ncbi:hypothetical protein AXF42_Ash014207 [Apostasia shenzhenica]|uniref:TRAF-type domain-containing protein n=1 Tax=Apostasia shenzhenica TaxID=1088818 RepID=A0A2I0A186_9ASPA|nr:hypothetical protein AXF42_Ash014207 [Apostasia shenzhenica]